MRWSALDGTFHDPEDIHLSTFIGDVALHDTPQLRNARLGYPNAAATNAAKHQMRCG
jgi:hypothetical protein